MKQTPEQKRIGELLQRGTALLQKADTIITIFENEIKLYRGKSDSPFHDSKHFEKTLLQNLLVMGEPTNFDPAYHNWRAEVLAQMDAGAEFLINEIAVELIKALSVMPLASAIVELEKSLLLLTPQPADLLAKVALEEGIIDTVEIPIAVVRFFVEAANRLGRNQFDALVLWKFQSDQLPS